MSFTVLFWINDSLRRSFGLVYTFSTETLEMSILLARWVHKNTDAQAEAEKV